MSAQPTKALVLNWLRTTSVAEARVTPQQTGKDYLTLSWDTSIGIGIINMHVHNPYTSMAARGGIWVDGITGAEIKASDPCIDDDPGARAVIASILRKYKARQAPAAPLPVQLPSKASEEKAATAALPPVKKWTGWGDPNQPPPKFG